MNGDEQRERATAISQLRSDMKKEMERLAEDVTLVVENAGTELKSVVIEFSNMIKEQISETEGTMKLDMDYLRGQIEHIHTRLNLQLGQLNQVDSMQQRITTSRWQRFRWFIGV